LTTKLLDTDFCVAVIRGQARPIGRYLAEAQNNELRISVITSFELLYGAERSGRSVEELAKVRAFVESGPTITDLDQADVAQAARLRADLAARGQMIGAYDLLIAGQALARGWPLLTANSREFSRVPNLALEDWRAPP
jgi:tRNA(fMet)-specific endonuclease VapC